MTVPGLRRIIEGSETAAGRRFDALVRSLIVLSLVSSAVETLPDLSNRSQAVLGWIEAGTVAAFTLEYVLRLLVAERKLGFILSFYGLVDLFAVLPFYVSSGVDLRSIRAFRLLRLFRVLKLVRYSRAIRRLRTAFGLIKEELVLFLSATLVVLYLSATGIYYFEREVQPEAFASVFHSLWWAVSTLTTVGYGDIYPITLGGRIFTFFVLIVGLGVVAAPCGMLASALSEARRLDEAGEDQ